MSRPLIQEHRSAAGAALVGAVALAATALGTVHAPARGMLSYVFAFIFWLSLSLGALLALLMFHATGSRWIAPFRRILELLALSVVLAVPLCLPLLLATPALYPWARPDWGPRTPEVVWTLRGFYLQRWFFVVRSLFYVASWAAPALMLLRISLRQDTGDGRVESRQLRVIGAITLPIVLFTGTFAAFDWVMSLTPDWSSEIFGLYLLTGGFLGAFSLFILVARSAFVRGLLPTVTRTWHFHNLGKLLFAVVCFWAYLAYDQYMLIWIANEPHEVGWYLLRAQTGWRAFFISLAIAQFVVPFFALLSRAAKVHLGFLGGVCIWLLATHAADVFWVVIPSGNDRALHWTDVTAFLGVGGLFIAFTLWTFARTPVVASGDPELEGAVAPAKA